MLPDEFAIALLAQLLRTRRLAPNQAQARDASSFLIDGNDWLDCAQVAKMIDQFPQLHCAFDVAAKENEASRLHLAKKRRRRGIDFLARHAGKDQLTEGIALHKLELRIDAGDTKQETVRSGGRSPDLRLNRTNFGRPGRKIRSTGIGLNRIGIYGGTFDPIHHGHLILAREAREILGLEEVIFVLAAQSPHKTSAPPANAVARWAMLAVATACEKGFSASRLEIDRPPPSYSIDTVERLRSGRPDTEFFFLIGEDNLPQLPSWHRFDELNRLVQFVVLDRSGATIEDRYRVVRRRIDISATTIRNRVASGQSIRYLVPEAVEQIIRRENLYQGANRSYPTS